MWQDSHCTYIQRDPVTPWTWSSMLLDVTRMWIWAAHEYRRGLNTQTL